MAGLQQFLSFAETVKHGSFASAARALGCAPSTLAKSVARLESSLGVKLFHRTTRQVSLTDEGERLFERCRRILDEIDELHVEAAGRRAHPSGTLRIDLPIVYGKQIVLPYLAALSERYPMLELDIRLQDRYVDLVKEGIDIAVRVGQLRDSTLIARAFDTQQLVLCAAPAYLERYGTPRTLATLASHTGVVFRQPSTGQLRPWHVRDKSGQKEIHPKSRIQVNDGEGMVSTVKLGLGIGQFPDYFVATEIATGALIELLPRHRPAAMPISVVYPSGRLLLPRVKVALEMFEEIRENRRMRK